MNKRRTTLFAAVSGTLILTASIFAVHYWKEYKRHCEVIELIDSISQERKQFLEERHKKLEAYLNDSILPRLEKDELPVQNGTLMYPYDPLLGTLGGPHPR